MNKKKKLKGATVLKGVAHALILFFVFLPILWGIRTSFAASTFDLAVIPKKLTWNNYVAILQTEAFPKAMKNSLLYAFGTICCLLPVIIPAAYALSRLKFKGQGFGKILLFIPLLPTIALLIPLSRTLNTLGLINTRFGVVLLCTVFQIPFTCWMLRNFFVAIPRSVEEAAYVDGCGKGKALLYIILPNSLTGIVAIMVYSFVSSWLSYLVPYSIVSFSELFTLSQTLLMFQGQYGTNYPQLTAAALMTILPPLMFFCVFQKWFIKGLFGISSK